jgi:hypothetical protein
MSVNHAANRLALRAYAALLLVCTTGSVTLTATATGYSRSDGGSFLVDGFAEGMDVTPAGFVANPVSTIVSLDATTITVADTRAAEGASPARMLFVGLPNRRAYENAKFTPTAGRPWVGDQYANGPSTQKTTGPLGTLEIRPNYTLDLYFPLNAGTAAADNLVDALLAHFASSTAFALPNGDALRVRTDTAPYATQGKRLDSGFWHVPVTIPLWLQTANTI